jgi:tRNA pseudouridine32 synthase/23S rRNA pseudouridine746 synthase
MGERHETDLVRIAAEAGERLLPAHRIDKVTSGVVLLAKTDGAHASLARQFNKRTVDKAYIAITRSTGFPAGAVIDLPLAVGRKNRVRIAAARSSIVLRDGRWELPDGEPLTSGRVYPSVTEAALAWEGADVSVLVARPVSGRRHQIRVHLAWVGHPIVGDPLFEKTAATRTGLHSWRLAFDATWAAGDEARVVVEAPPSEEFWALVPGAPVDLEERCRDALERL